MASFLFLLAFLGSILGFVFLTQATTGVGIIGVACLAAVFARFFQAEDQYKKLMERLNQLTPRDPSGPKAP